MTKVSQTVGVQGFVSKAEAYCSGTSPLEWILGHTVPCPESQPRSVHWITSG